MNANLVLLRKNGSHKAFPLPGPVTVIGRRGDCDLRIPLPMVSRRHCQFSRNNDSMELRDLESRGGTFVNGRRVEDTIALKAGDYIRIGPLTFVCQIDGKPQKIVPPKKDASAPSKGKPKPPPPKPTAKSLTDDSAIEVDADLSDLDVSGSFLNLDESDSDLEDLKNI